MDIPEFSIIEVMKEYQHLSREQLERLLKRARDRVIESKSSAFVGSGGLQEALVLEAALQRLVKSGGDKVG